MSELGMFGSNIHQYLYIKEKGGDNLPLNLMSIFFGVKK